MHQGSVRDGPVANNNRKNGQQEHGRQVHRSRQWLTVQRLCYTGAARLEWFTVSWNVIEAIVAIGVSLSL